MGNRALIIDISERTMNKNLENSLVNDKFQTIIIDVSKLNVDNSIKIIDSCIKEKSESFSDDGILWVICKYYLDADNNKSIQPLPFIIAKHLLSKGLKLKNIIIWPNFQSNKKSNIFMDITYYILFFTKNHKYFFNIDPVREKHIWKDVEWGKRKKNYHEKGKNPGNVWLKTEDDGNGNIIEHIPLTYTQMLERIILCSSKEHFAVLLKNIEEQYNLEFEGISLVYEK
jgi:hypothetical protein